MPQVRILSLRPKKQERGRASLLLFWLMCQFEAVLQSKMQVRIPRSQIDKLACQAKSVGITERSEVTLSLRPKHRRGGLPPLLCFYLNLPTKSLSFSQEKDHFALRWIRKISLSSAQKRGLNPVTPTKIGFGKQFSKPFSLTTATQFLRADDCFRQPSLFIISTNWNWFK